MLVAGGLLGISGGQTASAELYDPATNTWSAAASLATARAHHTAALLKSGRILVAGGDTGTTNTDVDGAELYTPGANAWSTGGSLVTARAYYAAAPLQSGQVLLVGGAGSGGILSSAEIFTPAPTPSAPALPLWAMVLLAAGLLGFAAVSLRKRDLAAAA